MSRIAFFCPTCCNVCEAVTDTMTTPGLSLRFGKVGNVAAIVTFWVANL